MIRSPEAKENNWKVNVSHQSPPGRLIFLANTSVLSQTAIPQLMHTIMISISSFVNKFSCQTKRPVKFRCQSQPR